jgi:hypothetical protein
MRCLFLTDLSQRRKDSKDEILCLAAFAPLRELCGSIPVGAWILEFCTPSFMLSRDENDR